MSSYISKIQVENGGQTLIGSSLYGICSTNSNTAAKVVTLNDFDALVNGVTIHVKFVNGNSVLNNVTLEVGTTLAQPVTGNCVCDENEVLAFTFEESGNNKYWRVNHSVKIDISNNIITKIAGQDVNAATKAYVDSKTQGLDGLVGAMHFIGETSTAVTNGGHENPTISNAVVTDKTAGDVVIYGNQEYVWNGSTWQLLGDEGSYALRSHTATVGVVSDTSLDWSAGATPTLGENIAADDITAWSAGSASNAVVQSGVLRLTNSVIPSLTYESRSIPNVTNVGSTPSLTITPTTVVVP